MMNSQQQQPSRRSSSSLNKVMIIGNIGGEPEMRFTPSGSPVTTFSVATNRIYNTTEGERKEETEWFNVVTWNKTAEYANQYLTKGRKVYVEGRLQTRSWEGQDGQKHSRVEVIANRVMALDRPPATAGAEGRVEGEESGDIEPQDLPF